MMLLTLADDFQASVRTRVEANLTTLRAARPHGATWDVLPVEGGWSACIRIPRHPGEQETSLAALRAGVAVHPGHFFDFPPGAAQLSPEHSTRARWHSSKTPTPIAAIEKASK